jgi:hypothetical protein
MKTITYDLVENVVTFLFQYDQLGLTPIQLQAKLEEFLTRDPNMFERKGPGAARNPVHTPQIPAFTFQVRAGQSIKIILD